MPEAFLLGISSNLKSLVESIQRALLDERDRILVEIDASPIKGQAAHFDSFNNSLDDIQNNLAKIEQVKYCEIQSLKE